jgi:hypothetical protein
MPSLETSRHPPPPQVQTPASVPGKVRDLTPPIDMEFMTIRYPDDAPLCCFNNLCLDKAREGSIASYTTNPDIEVRLTNSSPSNDAELIDLACRKRRAAWVRDSFKLHLEFNSTWPGAQTTRVSNLHMCR